MNSVKLVLLPIVGLLTLTVFTWSAYSVGAVFFNKLLVCALILGIVCIARIKGIK